MPGCTASALPRTWNFSRRPNFFKSGNPVKRRCLNTIELILPLRNPPAVLEKTVESLIVQTDKNFSVLLSDNHSTQGEELFANAIARFTAAGISVRRAKPPFELG